MEQHEARILGSVLIVLHNGEVRDFFFAFLYQITLRVRQIFRGAGICYGGYSVY
jgi:hypothetical protein